MVKALFLYSSREGQTKKILQYIEEQLPSYQCDVKNLHDIDTVDFSVYDKVLIGASIRYGHLNQKLYQFIQHNLTQLNEHKVAFFCVNLTARKEEQGKDTPEGSAYIRTFLKKSPWQPTLIGVFAGALYYPRYNWFDRNMIKLIMTLTGGETDTSKEVEYTNWKKVRQFSEKFACL
ncbi:menaquinone-dependent protoporphyrinogen IX dehydrogenase [Vibrio vulnificus]|uniref:menaquinone-dependent protoporphyrinogen IX dehydrogenase n=1 Tax=Vibrio vulnificus TaxID=672 RepID=UPI000D3EB657|nr:menaquinone-dependent protoporphyrinogen IX dehydrogenase [Vibrio vulnificus]MBN8141714.1 menaquinone-dependent protoporphyrinogen IX dehydrogenase [Vibrio vulnificus]MBN8151028.1 menaquinone-dependent protoporphyrinogen IX dehydrogenase [Vibrio vulnificus]MDS1872162.1 menaquinone-dependent protoporphyrinogen IX dehydrogenase [Vibrio vulnificus]NIG88784.1 menaquinone-dependent protoporphyrinogen IX dehydrogenase [Vibrio vulnificus]PUZ82931.1 menaquinone-dependent protoporphyrinogen IX dehyd